MKNIFNSIFKVMAVAVGFAAAATATAQESEEPIITFRTDIYNQSGPTSTYNIVIGATEAGHYIDVDCWLRPNDRMMFLHGSYTVRN